jgi:hypothetical protein
MDIDEIKRRFTSVEVSGKKAEQIRAIRENFISLAMAVDAWVEDGRDKGVALTQLELASHAVVAAVARSKE